jgi:hypothetical protein
LAHFGAKWWVLHLWSTFGLEIVFAHVDGIEQFLLIDEYLSYFL